MPELTPKTIAELPEAALLQDASIFPLSQNSASAKATFATLKKYVLSGGQFIANANDAFPSDADVVQFYRTSTSTLNTPYTEEIAAFSGGFILAYSSSANTCVQLCLMSGSITIFTRRYASGAWTKWRPVMTSEKESYTLRGIAQCSVTSNGISTTHIDFPNNFAYAGTTYVSLELLGAYTSVEVMSAIALSVANRSTTGFDIVVGVNATTALTSVNVAWQATGYAV